MVNSGTVLVSIPHQTFEYTYASGRDDEDHGFDLDTINKLGSEGWEAVGQVASDILMKRSTGWKPAQPPAQTDAVAGFSSANVHDSYQFREMIQGLDDVIEFLDPSYERIPELTELQAKEIMDEIRQVWKVGGNFSFRRIPPQICTRPDPHVCTVNGPCNGIPAEASYV